jgi:hypothetical protein
LVFLETLCTRKLLDPPSNQIVKIVQLGKSLSSSSLPWHSL